MVGVTSLKWFITQLALISVITNVNDTSVSPPSPKKKTRTAHSDAWKFKNLSAYLSINLLCQFI